MYPPLLMGFSVIIEVEFLRLFQINMKMPIFKQQRAMSLKRDEALLLCHKTRRLAHNTYLASFKMLKH